MPVRKGVRENRVIYTSEEYNFIEVNRVRSSNGYCSITIRFFNEFITISNGGSICDDDGKHVEIKENYEAVARELADLIEDACNDPVNLK